MNPSGRPSATTSIARPSWTGCTASRCLSVRVTEEIEIYRKLLKNSSLAGSPCAPDTLDMLAQFSVLARIKEPENSSIFTKLKVYDGQSINDTDLKSKSIHKCRNAGGVMAG